jgi:hypothetical protein
MYVVKVVWTARVSEVAAKYGEHAPTAAVCCNACRTCVTTNLVGLVTGALVAGAVGLRRAVRRLAPREQTADL